MFYTVFWQMDMMYLLIYLKHDIYGKWLLYFHDLNWVQTSTWRSEAEKKKKYHIHFKQFDIVLFNFFYITRQQTKCFSQWYYHDNLTEIPSGFPIHLEKFVLWETVAWCRSLTCSFHKWIRLQILHTSWEVNIETMNLLI